MDERVLGDRVGFYEIRIEGHLSDYRAREFAGMHIERQANGDTVISGIVVDQAALFGLLIRIRDLGMPLVSVKRRRTRKPGPFFIL
jgi:hypothetical protein